MTLCGCRGVVSIWSCWCSVTPICRWQHWFCPWCVSGIVHCAWCCWGYRSLWPQIFTWWRWPAELGRTVPHWVPALRTHGGGTVRTVYAALPPFHHSFSLLSVVTVMMWPLAVYHRLWDRVYVRLKPALQRLDFSVRGYMMSKQRERQCKCPGEPPVHLGSWGRRRSPEVWHHRSLNVEKWDVVAV